MAKKTPPQAPTTDLEKRVQELESQVASLKEENKELKDSQHISETMIAKLEHRLTLCKAFILNMYFYPGHIANMTSIFKGRREDDRSEAFKQFHKSFKAYTKKNTKCKKDLKSGEAIVGETTAKTSRWLVRGDILMTEYPRVLEEYLDSVKDNQAMMDRARAVHLPNFPSVLKGEV